MNLALYLSRVRSSEVLGIRWMLLSRYCLSVHWVVCGIRLNKAQSNFVTELDSRDDPPQDFTCGRIDRAKASAFEPQLKLSRFGFANAISTQPTSQVVNVIGTASGLQFTVESDFER
jgi:hypothetical protein